MFFKLNIKLLMLWVGEKISLVKKFEVMNVDV